jgi:hypothetical protein
LFADERLISQTDNFIIHSAQGKRVIFEAFEASPLSEQVLASENALQWDFPGCAVSMPYTDFENSSFQEELTTFLEQASRETIKRFAARTNKAGSTAYESRDTVDPALITQMLMTLLEANGQRILPPLLRKRVRDDVCWTDGAEKPWRRCAIWLVLRVALQRHLCTLFGDEAGRVHYKFLICVVLARLLDDSLEHLSPELLHFLKAKLCRRLVKLEVDKQRAPPEVFPLYEHMFAILGPIFEKTTQGAIKHIESSWTDFKKNIRRSVVPLPRYADQKDLYLTLPNSGNYLHQVLTMPLSPYGGLQTSAPWQLLSDYQASAAAARKPLEAFTNQYFSLSETETEIECSYAETPVSQTQCIQRCIELSEKIKTYLRISAGAYDSNPEHQSIRLLTVMELWMSMDKCAVKLFDLLLDYNPGFPSEMLNLLQLPRFKDMRRLQRLQQYLQGRLIACKGSRMTIFADPAKGCFAERYFDESKDAVKLNELHRRIASTAEEQRQAKETEWKKMSAEYERLIQEVAGGTCLFILDDSFLPAMQVHDDRQCTKCYLERASRRMRIQAHEDPLPANITFAKSVVFELGIPQALAAYRDTTWKILGTLALPDQTGRLEPRLLLHEYPGLKAYVLSTAYSFSLASTTKSFLTTHYANVRFPATLDSVLLPNGLKYGYFDTHTKIWPGRQHHKPSFAHHCQLILPKNSPFSSFHALHNAAIDGEGLSSYEVIASQSQFPPGLNIHEFMAYQSLLSGKNRRWPAILIELGSSNLNFSSESIAALVSHLAMQAGPALEYEPFRSVHRVFRDESFCKRLMHQLGQRLESISPNFREIFCMDMLVTLMLRLHSMASEPSIIAQAVELLESARAITHKWIGLLRAEIRKATDAGSARKWSQYAFMSAILCRRTFGFHAEDNDILEVPALRCFIECSITLQDNLVGDPKTLPHLARTSLIRDLKTVNQMRFILRKSLIASKETVMSAISAIWPEPAGVSRVSSKIEFEKAPNEWWVQVIVGATKELRQQVVHYHLLHGILLVDGLQLGKLPQEHRESVILQQLFGNQSLLTYPSAMPGMTYMLGFQEHGHQIHLGFRNRNLIVRAWLRSTVLELVPRDVFGPGASFDLPAELIDNCVHWLDLATGVIEVRQKPEIWRSKLGNWRIDVNTRRATRRKVTLVDPQSLLFGRVARVFDLFEYRRQLTVFQPVCGPLQVECRRLELSFFVNGKYLLQARQLGAEIDTDQDAGTWYGLSSKLVLRDILNPRLRSIIVPMGAVMYRRNGFHVSVEISNEGLYGRFTINDVLGRLECASEPRLLYLKAYLHACTSSFLVDTLTQRTGTEEALHILKSGYCQPWMPLGPHHHGMLMEIAKLTPSREYYPKDRKVMQRVSWNENFTTTIQHDGFRAIVEAICEKSAQLSMFAFEKIEVPSLEYNGDVHLRNRSYARRRLYQRPNADSKGHMSGPDFPYDARDHPQSTQSRLNVYESVSTIRAWASRLPTTTDLAGILQNWANIGGYHGTFDKILLSDRLDADFASHWGALVNLCRASSPKDRDMYQLMFLLATVSFQKDVDMEIVRVLIAFSALEDLKLLEPPIWPCYVQFRHNQVPHMNYLLQLLRPFCVPYSGDARSALQFSISVKQLRNLEAVELAHEQQVEADGKAIAQFLLNQWPCLEPVTEGFLRSVLIDLPPALKVIRGEWQRIFQNFELSQHIQHVQQVLDRHRVTGKVTLPMIMKGEQAMLPLRYCGGECQTMSRDLLRKAGPILTKQLDQPPSDRLPRTSISKPNNGSVPREIQELGRVINSFAQSESTVRQQYADDLKKSLNAVKLLKSTLTKEEEPISPSKIGAQIFSAKQTINKQFDQICKALQSADPCAKWLQSGDLYPAITAVTLLENLRSTLGLVFGRNMKESVLNFALSITNLQRLIRIEDAHLKKNAQKMREEQENKGHGNWDVRQYPDWVLLEIDANMLIRPDQVHVALATIGPFSGKNSVLQMNMGQGKLTCSESLDSRARKPPHLAIFCCEDSSCFYIQPLINILLSSHGLLSYVILLLIPYSIILHSDITKISNRWLFDTD